MLESLQQDPSRRIQVPKQFKTEDSTTEILYELKRITRLLGILTTREASTISDKVALLAQGGFSSREIAAILDVTPQVVSVRLQEVRRAGVPRHPELLPGGDRLLHHEPQAGLGLHERPQGDLRPALLRPVIRSAPADLPDLSLIPRSAEEYPGRGLQLSGNPCSDEGGRP